MTQLDWQDELADAIAGTGWRVFTASASPLSVMCYAHLDHEVRNEQRTIKLSRDRFDSRPARATEIRRQLGVGAATVWERHHRNGWRAEVRQEDAGYTCKAFHRDEAHVRWGGERIPTLDEAQQRADAKVPAHDCTCPPWVERT